MKLWEKYGIEPDTASPPMAMDYEHVEELALRILGCRPEIAVEIGSYKGHSTVAFLYALDYGYVDEFHIFEIAPTPELLRLIDGRPNVHLHTEPIWKSNLRPNLVFIDGDHGVPALADLAFCLARDVRVIAMHDTNGHTAGLTPEGSEIAANLLREAPGRVWWEDKQQRDGKWTHRGFGVSTKL